jgi:DNA topoisomerase-1
VTGKPVQLLDGRYGPYVADGETNASLPKDQKPEELSFEQALNLLADRAALGPPKKRPTRRAKASAPAKKSAKKTAKKATKGAKKAVEAGS